MSKGSIAGLVSVFALVAGLAAQEGGARGFGSGAGEAGGSLRAPTRFEQFIGKLKMDSKTQAPLVTAMLQDVAKEASPVGGQMTQLQNQLLNALLLHKSEAELKPILDAHTEAAARMTGLEAKTFSQIYAMLKPNQQSGAVQAFDLMAGWLQPPPPSGGRQHGAGGRGRGGVQ